MEPKQRELRHEREKQDPDRVSTTSFGPWIIVNPEFMPTPQIFGHLSQSIPPFSASMDGENSAPTRLVKSHFSTDISKHTHSRTNTKRTCVRVHGRAHTHTHYTSVSRAQHQLSPRMTSGCSGLQLVQDQLPLVQTSFGPGWSTIRSLEGRAAALIPEC